LAKDVFLPLHVFFSGVGGQPKTERLVVVEKNVQWQEDVLRNATLTTSILHGKSPGLHTLKVWMVDPGIVVDAIMLDANAGKVAGYLWPSKPGSPKTQLRLLRLNNAEGRKWRTLTFKYRKVRSEFDRRIDCFT